MTSKERLLTALRGQQPDRTPVIARREKFLRKYYADIDPKDRPFRSAEEFNTDLWKFHEVFPMPCFDPRARDWRKDVQVAILVLTAGDRLNRRQVGPSRSY